MKFRKNVLLHRRTQNFSENFIFLFFKIFCLVNPKQTGFKIREKLGEKKFGVLSVFEMDEVKVLSNKLGLLPEKLPIFQYPLFFGKCLPEEVRAAKSTQNMGSVIMRDIDIIYLLSNTGAYGLVNY